MNSKDIGYTALATAFLTVSAWLALHIGTTCITMQSAAVCITAGVLGCKRATLATVTYILLGMIGVPVFAGFTGGLGHIFSPMGGYILGFLPMALSVGLTADLYKTKVRILCVGMGIGLLFCYIAGTFWFMAIAEEQTGFWSAIVLCVLPYLPFDILKLILSAFLTVRLRKILKMT